MPKSYAEEFAAELAARHEQDVLPLGGGAPTTTRELIIALGARVDGEVFIEIDRGVIADVTRERTDLLRYLYPVAVRYDGDDVIIHITDADNAQFGHIEGID